jgi:hypothetical protein
MLSHVMHLASCSPSPSYRMLCLYASPNIFVTAVIHLKNKCEYVISEFRYMHLLLLYEILKAFVTAMKY